MTARRDPTAESDEPSGEHGSGSEEGVRPEAVHVVEDGAPLVESVMWRIERHAYESQGVEGWRTGTLPQYATTNPFIARAYARVVLAFLRDNNAGSADQLGRSEPVTILELGAGPGRFAYYFVETLQRLLAQSRLADVRFRYVLTDLAAANVSFWRDNERLAPLVEAGLVDFARFDVGADATVRLEVAGTELTAGSLSSPVVVIANYLFDSLPIDAWKLSAGSLARASCTMRSPDPNVDLDAPDVLPLLELSYDYRPVDAAPYDDPALVAVLDAYADRLGDTTVSLPVAALRGLSQLAELAGGRMLLLSADKGYSREEDLLFQEDPIAVFHGPVLSMSVNYHAIGAWFEQMGGGAMHPSARHSSLEISAFYAGLTAADLQETVGAYRDFIDGQSPDDFLVLSTDAQADLTTVSVDVALSYLRFSGFDPDVFLRLLPVFMEKAEDLPGAFKDELAWAATQVWRVAYPIGEEWDLPFYIGMLLFEMQMPSDAIEYLNHSLRLYGPAATTYYDLALSHMALGDDAKAEEYARASLAEDPKFGPAKGLAVRLESTRARSGAAPNPR